MTLHDLIAFIITFGLFIAVIVKNILKSRRALTPVDSSKRGEDDELRDYLKALDLDPDDETLPPEIKPQVIQPKRFTPKPPPPPVYKKTENAANYEVLQREQPSAVERLLKESPHPKNLLIYYEIFGPPKSLRDSLQDRW